MANLIINVRCTCEEEFLLLHKLHKLYQEDQLRKRLKERLIAGSISSDGTFTETVERVFRPSESEIPQAVDGGVDALGNPPLPEKPLTLDEARAIGSGYAEQEEKSSISEFAIGDRAEEFHYEDAKPDFGPAAEPTHFAEEPVKAKPEITLTDVLEAEALERAEDEYECQNGEDRNTCA